MNMIDAPLTEPESAPATPSARMQKEVGRLDCFVLTRLAGAYDAWHARPEQPEEKQLIDALARVAAKRGIEPPPLIIYRGKFPNALSLSLTGSVAVSADLPSLMTPPQLEAVMGHELSHHRHRLRDALALAAGVLGFTTAYEHLVSPRVHTLAPQGRMAELAFRSVEAVALMGAMIGGATAYKRALEYEADREGAELTSPQAKIGALKALQHRVVQQQQREATKEQLHHAPKEPLPAWQQLLKDTAKEIEPRWVRKIRHNPLSVVRSHPPLHRRIARLECMAETQEASLSSSIASR